MSDPLNLFRETLSGEIERRGGYMAVSRATDAAGRKISYQTIMRWASGETRPDLAEFLVLCRALGLSPDALFPVFKRGQDGDDSVRIPRLDVEAAAGDGRMVDVVTAATELPFPRAFAERMAPRGADLQCLTVRGDSMEPTIQNGAMIVIDRKQRDLPKWMPTSRKAPRRHQKPDGIYVFMQSGLVRLKRLRDLGDHLVAVISDNDDIHPLEIIRLGRDGGLRIIGRVVWWDVRG